MEFLHKPVLLKETINSLNVKENGIYVDGTVGGGGHSLEILNSAKNVKLIAIDRDIEAIEASKKKLSKYLKQITFIHDNYENIPEILEKLNIKVDGVLLDLGVSSYQIDEKSRGFSFKLDSPLDMRMDKDQDYTAKDFINNSTESEIAKVIFKYGEEKFAGRIAHKIVEKRPIETTGELAEIIDEAVPKYKGRDINQSLARVFQAIRIVVNGEIEGLNDLIVKLPEYMNKGARISIISFHSLEDRVVKYAFRELATDCICPKNIPICVCGHRAKVKLITHKPIIATNEEIKENSRSTSAKLRVAEII